jgi:hypothetical protein
MTIIRWMRRTTTGRCRIWVKLRNTQHEQMSSALPSTTDINTMVMSALPIGRLVAFDHRSGFFCFKKLEFLRANEPHRS